MKKTIKIGFVSGFSAQWMGGINYFKNLFIALSQLTDPKVEIYIILPLIKEAEFLLQWAKPMTKLKKKSWKYPIYKAYLFVTKKSLLDNKYYELIFSENIDIISHAIDLMQPKLPQVGWIPDFQHIRYPEMFDCGEINMRDNNCRKIAQKSNLVILSSYDALNDFQNFCPEYAHKGRVLQFVAIPPNDIYEKTDKMAPEIISKFSLPEKYFYVPNQFWKHKNHMVVLKAITVIKKYIPKVCVVFSGCKEDYRDNGHYSKIMDAIKENNISNNIKILGLIDMTEVYYLMRKCVSIINPSLFEGWSSTVEEAKSLGKNVILSDINVHREQRPTAVEYFEPNNHEQLANIMKTKWEKHNRNADLPLEQRAKEELPGRILEFSKKYIEIVSELF
jgi:glycosyltransferase involved in cell wall biosynthesis